MKKVIKVIVMILVVVMLVNSVTGCIVIAPALGLPYGKLGQTFDLAMLGVAVVATVVYLTTGIDLSNFTSLPVLNGGIGVASGNQSNAFLEDRIEQSSFMKIFNALPETQIDMLTQKIQAVPETEIISFMETVNAESQTDIMDKLSTVSEIELLDTVGYLNSLSEIQFITLLRNIQYW